MLGKSVASSNEYQRAAPCQGKGLSASLQSNYRNINSAETLICTEHSLNTVDAEHFGR